MTIDFHSEQNRGTYATRDADESWKRAMLNLIDPHGKHIADIGCGGGIYSRAWSNLGAAAVTGIDFSAPMVADAREQSRGVPTLSFVQGDAAATGLPAESVDIAFSRAVIHHLPELDPAFHEAFRILKPRGVLIIQDRTIEDVLHPASPAHLRGYFFEAFPRLLDLERQRRPSTTNVTQAIQNAGFTGISTSNLSETRRTYQSIADLQADLRPRTGRSILHALDADESEHLINHITNAVKDAFPLIEEDHWTVWSAHKPG